MEVAMVKREPSDDGVPKAHDAAWRRLIGRDPTILDRIRDGQTTPSDRAALEDAKWDDLVANNPELATVREHHKEVERMWREPRRPLRDVLAASGIAEVTLRNWLTRNRLSLDADAARQGTKHRLFSDRDIVMIALGQSFAAVGMPITAMRSVIDRMMPMFDTLATNAMGLGGEPVLYLWKVGDDWSIAKTLDTKVGELGVDDVPLAAIALRPHHIFRRVFSRLGETVTVGTADDHRAASNPTEHSE